MMAFKKKKPSWVKYIHQRIERNKNFLSMIVGPTGSGKSWSGLSLAEMLDPEFSEERIIFRATELFKLINSGHLKSGSVILWDEAGIDLNNRNWQSVTNKVLNSLLQTFRHKNFILIFTVPYSDFLDSASQKLFHAQFETQNINKSTQRVKLRPKLLQYNPAMKKWYFHFLKVLKAGKMIKIKTWSVPKPSHELIELYEKKKSRFTKNLNEELEKMLAKAYQEQEKEYETAMSPLKKPLTDRQEEIATLLKETNAKGVAEKLGVNLSSVQGHITAIQKKGIILKPIIENGVRVRYDVQNLPEKLKSAL